MIIKIFTLFIKLGILLVFCVRHNYGLFLFAVDRLLHHSRAIHWNISSYGNYYNMILWNVNLLAICFVSVGCLHRLLHQGYCIIIGID